MARTFARASDAVNLIINSDDSALLSVDSATGVVSLTADPDYETKNSIQLCRHSE